MKYLYSEMHADVHISMAKIVFFLKTEGKNTKNA